MVLQLCQMLSWVTHGRLSWGSPGPQQLELKSLDSVAGLKQLIPSTEWAEGTYNTHLMASHVPPLLKRMMPQFLDIKKQMGLASPNDKEAESVCKQLCLFVK